MNAQIEELHTLISYHEKRIRFLEEQLTKLAKASINPHAADNDNPGCDMEGYAE